MITLMILRRDDIYIIITHTRLLTIILYIIINLGMCFTDGGVFVNYLGVDTLNSPEPIINGVIKLLFK